MITFLVFSLTAVSASDSEDFNLQNDIDESDLSVMDSYECSTSLETGSESIVSGDENSNPEEGPNSKDGSNTEEDPNDDSGSDSTETELPEVYSASIVSSHAECQSMKVKYTVGNIIYKVKPYDIVKINGTDYFSPMYNKKVNLRVFTLFQFKLSQRDPVFSRLYRTPSLKTVTFSPISSKYKSQPIQPVSIGEYPLSIAVRAATVVDGYTDDISVKWCCLRKASSARCSLSTEAPIPSKSITITFL